MRTVPTSFHWGQYFFSRESPRSLSNKEQIISLLFARYRTLRSSRVFPVFLASSFCSPYSTPREVYFLEAIQTLSIVVFKPKSSRRVIPLPHSNLQVTFFLDARQLRSPLSSCRIFLRIYRAFDLEER